MVSQYIELAKAMLSGVAHEFAYPAEDPMICFRKSIYSLSVYEKVLTAGWAQIRVRHLAQPVWPVTPFGPYAPLIPNKQFLSLGAESALVPAEKSRRQIYPTPYSPMLPPRDGSQPNCSRKRQQFPIA